MAFSRVKVSGWGFGETLTSSQMNSLDIDHANAIDGANGGTYNLANPLVISGDHVTISETLNVGDTINTQALVVSNVADINTDLTVTGDVSCDDLVAADDGSFGGDMSISGSTTVGGPVRLTGAGRTCQSAQVVSTTSSSVDVTQHQNIFFGALAATTTTLTATSPVDGDWFTVCNNSGNNQTLAGLASVVLADNTLTKYVRISGTWTVVLFIVGN